MSTASFVVDFVQHPKQKIIVFVYPIHILTII
jgi:hypothetical protein